MAIGTEAGSDVARGWRLGDHARTGEWLREHQGDLSRRSGFGELAKSDATVSHRAASNPCALPRRQAVTTRSGTSPHRSWSPSRRLGVPRREVAATWKMNARRVYRRTLLGALFGWRAQFRVPGTKAARWRHRGAEDGPQDDVALPGGIGRRAALRLKAKAKRGNILIIPGLQPSCSHAVHASDHI